MLIAGVGVAALFGSQRFATLARLRGEAEDDRVRLLGDYMGLLDRYFPSGAGFGAFPDVYRHVERAEEISPNYLNHAHNDLVELAIEGGAAGLLLLAIALVWLLVRSSQEMWRGFRSQGDNPAAVAAIVVVVLLAGSAVDYPLRTPLLASLFVACSAVMAMGIEELNGGRLGMSR